MMQRLKIATRGAMWRLIFAGLLIGGGVAAANYNATQGSGTAFGSIVVSAVHYAQQLLCDPTTPSQCAAVSAGGAVSVSVSNANSNGQATMANSSPVTLASNQSVADPCAFQAKVNKNINTASGTTLLVSASGSTKVYICSFALIAPSAVSVSLSEGTGATCNTANQAGIMGVAVNGTAANGMALPANGGLTYGNGEGTVAQTATAANAVCLFQSGTAQLAGNISYVQQ